MQVFDERGTLVSIGSRVKCGDEGEPGVVVDITEPEDRYGRVMVKWPEWDEPEGFVYSPNWPSRYGGRRRRCEVCQDVEVIPCA